MRSLDKKICCRRERKSSTGKRREKHGVGDSDRTITPCLSTAFSHLIGMLRTVCHLPAESAIQRLLLCASCLESHVAVFWGLRLGNSCSSPLWNSSVIASTFAPHFVPLWIACRCRSEHCGYPEHLHLARLCLFEELQAEFSFQG